MSIDAGTVAAYLTLDTGKYTSSLQTAKLQMTTFMDFTNSAGERLDAFGSGLSTIGTTLIKGVTLPLIGAGTAITMVSANFESAMSEVKAISGAVGEEFDALRDKAKELGESTRFSATEAANGMSNLASAGFQVNEIIAAMPGLLDLAVSGNIDLASASDIAASTLRGFNLEASETAHVADVLARAAADTNAGIIDTGDAMKYIAPVANAMGHSLESVTAAVGLLSNAGIKGGQAGTVLRSALARLASPSKEAADIMGDLGFSAYDTSGKMLSLSGIVGSLEASMAGLTEQERQNTITTIFGQEAMSGMLALMQSGPEEIDRLTSSLENCDGAAAEMAEIMGDNLQGQITELKSKLEGISITLGETLLPAVSDIVGGIKTAADAFAELNPGAQEFIVKAGLVAAAAGPLLTVGGKLISGVGQLIPLVSSLGSALYALTGPAGIVIGLVGLVGAGAVAAWNKYEKAQEEARQSMLNCGEALRDLSTKAHNAADNLTQAENLERQWRDLSRTLATCKEGTKEYATVKEKLAEVEEKLIGLSDGLITHYDAENGNIETQLPLLQEKLRVEKELYELELRRSVQDKDIGKMGNDVMDLKNHLDDLHKLYNEQEHAYSQLKVLKLEYTRLTEEARDEDEVWRDQVKRLKEEIVELGLVLGQYYSGDTLLLYDDIQFLYDLEKAATEAMNGTDEAISKLTSDYTAGIDSINAFAETLEKAKDILSPDEYEALSAALDDVKNALASKIDTSLSDDLSDLSGAAGTAAGVISGLPEIIKNAVDAFSDLKSRYKDGEITSQEYTKALNNQIVTVSKLITGNTSLSNSYTDLFKEMNAELVSQLTDSTSDLMTKSEKLTDVIKEQKEQGKLSNNTVMDMISSGYALALQIDKETGAVTLNTDMYMKLTQAKIQDQIATLEGAKQTALITRMELEKDAADAAAQSLYGLTLAKRAEAESSVDSVADIEAQIAILKNLMDNLGSVTNSYKSASKKEENKALKEAIKDLENRIELENLATTEIIKNYEEIKKAYAKSKDEITDLDKKIKKYKEQQYQDELDLIDHQYKMNIIILDEKIRRQAEIHVKYKDMIKDEKKLDLELYTQQKELLGERLSDIDKVVQKTKDIYTGTFDYSKEIKSLEELIELYRDYPAILNTINDKLEESRKNLTNQTARIKQDDINDAIEAIRYEIELRGQMDGVVLQNSKIYRYTAENKIADTYRIIEANEEMIDYLQSQGETMTEDQAEMLKDRLGQQKGYYKEITTLAVQAAKDYRSLEEELTQTHKKQLTDRAKADSDYNKDIISANKKKNDDLLKANEDYAKKVKDINQKLADNEKKLTEAYNNEFNQRVKGYTNFVGIFNEVSKKNVSGQQLLVNLQAQLETMEDFRKNLAELADKGIDENLFKELQEMGPGAAAEIAALNALTEEELDEYVKIYQAKSKLANNEVFTQMEAQRNELQTSLEQMRRDASSELSLLNQEYFVRLEEINAIAETELNTLTKTWEEKLAEINKDATEKVAELTAKMKEASQALQLGASLETDENAAKILSSAAKLASDKVVVWENENIDYSGLQVEQTAINALEIEKQLSNIEESNKSKKASYVRDRENQGKQESQKTDNTKKELRVQEREILSSQERNIATLWSFVPKWSEIGVSYGEALLQGIQETRGRIQSYLDDVVASIKASQSGWYSSIGAYASGTNSAAAGLALVGEYGMPEIVDFSGGEQVVNFQESIAMMSRAASVADEYSNSIAEGFSSNGSSSNRTYEEIDYDKLASKVADLINNNSKPALDYHPTYISPRETSISEQRRQDRINMQRLGFNF